MKNSQKGFVVPLLIAVIALLVIGGGVYIYQNKKTPTIVETETQQTNTQTPPVNTENENIVPKTNDQNSSALKKPVTPIPQLPWVTKASSPALEPVKTSDGILLKVEKTGDESIMIIDLGIPENAYLLSFDMKFKKEGDGDWLTTNFNNNLLFSFRGDSFFDVNEYQHIELNIRSLAGQAGMIDFTLHGSGTTTSEVLIKNILISGI